MTSATTSTSRGLPARLAASSLLALAMMLGACAAAPPAYVRQVIADAQVKVQAVDDDLHRLEDQVATVPSTLRTAVTDAVASAEAATQEARTALARAAAQDDAAVVALADAQVALDAASAELRHVIGELASSGVADDEVGEGLSHLAEQIDVLRGETSRAGA
ncbi:hypothetical protein [Isoptericola variabilis]|uniref:Lipoprotein n=1 Tax=Isoptericola variabilis (strain 225) TaxID=743718 RepID=F6FQW0_ISOV2|nr:hypothetical protein [Isoptericola variabilis]AEG42925.1 hypothetical protein Isova_0111 [Isoptericola variabilis 225]TWH31826.1 hypothetical protein L600_002000000350 [Isoptericola variabilis J7]